MLIRDSKTFYMGFFMAVTFAIVLVLMFSPIINGGNALTASDNLFNSISKGSSYYLVKLSAKVAKYDDKTIEAVIEIEDKELIEKAKVILTKNEFSSEGEELVVKGSLGKLLGAAIKDSDEMYNNRGAVISEKYGMPEKEAIFVFWSLLKGLEKSLTKQKNFAEAAVIKEVMKKAVEMSYNYYGITPEKASTKAGILGFSLVFYIAYTLWWGYGIYFMFEGIGLTMKKGHKKEV
jgi:hypothetical protein